MHYREIPVFEGVRELIARGMAPEGAYNNMKFLEGRLEHGGLPEEELLLFSDPQTSGGLLITLSGKQKLAPFEEAGVEFRVIGRVVEGSARIIIKN